VLKRINANEIGIPVCSRKYYFLYKEDYMFGIVSMTTLLYPISVFKKKVSTVQFDCFLTVTLWFCCVNIVSGHI